MKKAIVTGAGGYIGGTLVRLLLSKGVVVYGIDISEGVMEEFLCNGNFRPVVADFKKYKELNELITDSDIDIFYHFAWAGGFTAALKDYNLQLENAKYACDALIAANEIGCKKFVLAGTVNEYEIIDYLNQNYCEPRYTCIYATGKVAAEMICKTLASNLNISYCSGLIPMIYGGKNKSKQLVNVVISQLLNGISPKLITGENDYDVVHVDDVAEGFYAIGEHGHNNTSYYMGHSRLKKFREWIEEIQQIIAPDVDLKFGEYPDNLNIDYSRFDLERLERDTGYVFKRELSDIISEYSKWVKTLKF